MTPLENKPPQNPVHCLVQEGCSTRLQLSHRVAELEARVSTDALTGLWNRSHFDQIIEKELDRSLRHKQPISLILLDVDHFKGINDRFGHHAGDKVLRELAIVANLGVRSSDALFRWGGEEFAVLAMSSGHRGAGRLAESLRSQVAGHLFPAVGTVTVSMGVAEYTDSEGAEAWFKRADAMLYAAKRDGRNAVRIDAQGNSDLWSAHHITPTLNLAWQEAYECGDPTIDQEHRVLFEKGNDLLDAAFRAEAQPALFSSEMERLLTHIAMHFRDEEQILAERGYADLETHKSIHHALLKRAEKLRSEVEGGRITIGALVEFVANTVIAHHIFKEDQKYFHLFRKDPASACAVEPA